MAEQPAASRTLIELLDRLQLATAGQVESARPLVTRLSRDLPQFDSVWVDALAQARVLTPFQAAQINAGRGAGLQTGPYVLRAELPGPGYARCYSSAQLATSQLARLLIVEHTERALNEVATELARLVEQSRLVGHEALAAVHDAGVDGTRVWAACRPVAGTPAARWMVENGRLPATVVLHIARQMVAALAELEQLELAHGDLSALGLLLLDDGHIVMPHPGLRAIVRPAEGYAYGDLPPEAYDTLAPERIAAAAAPSTVSDIYACGCLWWHLATGRAPFAGGNTIAKLRAVHSAKAADVEQLAPDVPPALAHAIRACMSPNPAQRPRSMTDVAELLGPTVRGAAQSVRQLMEQPHGPRRLWRAATPRRNSWATRLGNATVVAACLGLLLGTSVGWRYRHQLAWWPHWGRSEARSALAAKAGEHAPRADRAAADRKVAAKSESKRRNPLTTATTTDAVKTPAEPDERGVVLASHTAESNSPAGKTVQPRLLPTDRPQRIAELDLKNGQTVRGLSGGRPLVYVSPQGLVVRGENVSFENIDFVWDATAAAVEPDGEPPAIIRLSADQAEFRGCSFQDVRSRADRLAADWQPLAILWTGVSSANGRGTAPLGGDLVCDNCVFSGVEAGIECRSGRAPSIEIRQSLHLLSGPLLRLAFCPRRDQSVMLNLTNCTVRASTAVLECRMDSSSREKSFANAPSYEVGQMAVRAVDSVFALDSTAALVLFTGAEPSDALVDQLDWTGQGSLATPTAVMAAWRRDRDSVPRSLAEDRLQVAGLVRSQVEFAGESSSGLAGARIRRWQAPLRSNEPPGAGPGRLVLPAVGPMGR